MSTFIEHLLQDKLNFNIGVCAQEKIEFALGGGRGLRYLLWVLDHVLYEE